MATQRQVSVIRWVFARRWNPKQRVPVICLLFFTLWRDGSVCVLCILAVDMQWYTYHFSDFTYMVSWPARLVVATMESFLCCTSTRIQCSSHKARSSWTRCGAAKIIPISWLSITTLCCIRLRSWIHWMFHRLLAFCQTWWDARYWISANLGVVMVGIFVARPTHDDDDDDHNNNNNNNNNNNHL